LNPTDSGVGPSKGWLGRALGPGVRGPRPRPPAGTVDADGGAPWDPGVPDLALWNP